MDVITIGSKSDLIATINLTGAELTSLKRNGETEYIWSADPEFWGKSSPVLFPIVGTIKNNAFFYNGKTYSLNRHGFAREMAFEIVKKQENSAVFMLRSSEETLENYPFEFDLTITYTISNDNLNIEYGVANLSDVAMPFKLGAHPAFALTDHFENYQLEFADDNQLNCFHLEDGLLSGETNTIPLYNNRLDLNYKLFEKDALVIKQLNSKLVTILKSGLPYLRLHLNDFPNLGIWTKPGAGFICVEPWLGYTDPIDATEIMEQKESIQILNPHEKLTCGFAIEIL